MTTWVLIIAIVSIGGVSDVKHIQMTGANAGAPSPRLNRSNV